MGETGATVADAMLTSPKVCGADVRVADVRDLFTDDHVHAALVVDGRRLLSVVDRDDVAEADAATLAAPLGRLEGRTVASGTTLETAHERMLATGIRRLAVIDDEHALLGLLCLTRSGTGFCSDGGVAARAAERAAALAMAALGPRTPTYDAIVLAGGRATRMGGRDKTALSVGGVALLDRVLASVSRAHRTVTVGPEIGGGPVAAIASALPSTGAEIVLTLAGDMPLVGGAIGPLLAALTADASAEVAVLVTGEQRQYLAAAWRRHALAARIARLATPENAALRGLFGGRVVTVPDLGGWSTDVDTPDDLAAVRAAVTGTLTVSAPAPR